MQAVTNVAVIVYGVLFYARHADGKLLSDY